MASIDLPITLKVVLTTPFKLSRFWAIFLPVTFLDSVSNEVITVAIPLAAAFFKLPNEVAIPSELTLANFASSPVPVPRSINLFWNSLKVTVPSFNAAYKSL